MAQYRLKENHSTLIKVRELEGLAEELGLEISVGYGDQLLITDRYQAESPVFQYRDIEQGINSHDTTNSFPYHSETKLIFEKEED